MKIFELAVSCRRGAALELEYVRGEEECSEEEAFLSSSAGTKTPAGEARGFSPLWRGL